jgi:hypothetical protein
VTTSNRLAEIMAKPALKTLKSKALPLYLNPDEDFKGAKAHVMVPRRDGTCKSKLIWRVTKRMGHRYTIRGASCSNSPSFIERLVQGLMSGHETASATLQLYGLRAPVVEVNA